jgi:hypothetical protein
MSKKKPWIIDEWKKNNQEIIRVAIDLYNGKNVISIRTWYKDDDGKLKPGKQGASYELKHLKNISKAMKQAYIQARKNRLI